MPSKDETLLCRYHYDPLDRLADCTPAAQASTRRFYLKERLASEIQGSLQRSIFQHDDQLLAQRQRKDEVSTATLLATDQQRSVLRVLDAAQPHPLAYTPYGHRAQENGLLSLLGFNGERPDPVTGHYLLGNGYRAFNPVLMRFHSPDNLSPFEKGGLNAYAYCLGDPVNKTDPTGHFPNLWKALLNVFKLRTPSTRAATTSSQATALNAANAVTPPNTATAIPPPSYSAGNLNGLRPPRQRGEPPAYRSLPPDYDDHGLDPLILATQKKYQNGGPPTYPEAEGLPWLFMPPRRRTAFLRYARSSTSSSSSNSSSSSSSGWSSDWSSISIGRSSRSSQSSQGSDRSSISLSAEQVDRIRRLS
ncbi:RHS repeat-associated core domain-containing protein [Pseudomonas sp. FP198]|uniref:RHS repeat-associated core domain-containing protein n=1 Tax=Pseudomonas sp. FP198 TaxID=2954084 RepID=UPI003521905C